MPNNKKNVLIITEGYPSKIYPTRLVFVEEQAKEIAKYVNVTIICPVEIRLPVNRINIERRRKNLSLKTCEIRDNIKIFFPRYYCYVPKLNFRFALFMQIYSVFCAIIRNQIKFDVVHAHFAYPAGYVAAKISKLFKKPFVITVHGYDIIDKWLNKKFTKKRKPLVKFALKSADEVICVSEYLKQEAINLTDNSNKFTVISNGIDFSRFNIHKKLDGSKNKATKNILFIGNLIPRKGIAILIQAFEKIKPNNKNVRLSIIGNGYLFDGLKNLARQKKLQEDICFLGALDNAEIPSYLNKCSLLCLPSLNEPFGVVLIEALACGKPVVASRVGGMVDIVESEKVGLLFEPGNVDDLAHCLKKALSKTWNAQEIRSYAKKYSMENVAQKILNVYNQVLNNEVAESTKIR